MIKATLSHEQARLAYRRLGGALDVVGVYENIASRKLIRHAHLERAASVFELGCGTGAFAQMALEKHLPGHAVYKATDVTPEMVASTKKRLEKFGDRVRIELSEGAPPTAEPTGAYDRFISNYVFDLLSEADISAMFVEAHRMLSSEGFLCLSGLAPAQGPLSKVCVGLWSKIYEHKPSWVGGCRPIQLLPFIDSASWVVLYHGLVTPLGFPLEVVVAKKRA